METVIYFDSKTGNVARFVHKVSKLRPSWRIVSVAGQFRGRGHLITYSTGAGHVPQRTVDFLEKHAGEIDTVSASGNRNWGARFGAAAYQINDQYGIKIGLLFELSGFECDVNNFIEEVESSSVGTSINTNESIPRK